MDACPLNPFISPFECNAITKIPLPLWPYPKSMLWHYSPDGSFLVKLVYALITPPLPCPLPLEQMGFWSAPKNKAFSLGKLVQIYCPLPRHFIRKKIVVSPHCPRCNTQLELVFHCSVSCHSLSSIWFAQPLGARNSFYPSIPFAKWLKGGGG